MKVSSIAVVASLMSALAFGAQAAPITYIFTGVADGSLNGAAFTDTDFTLTLFADTAGKAAFGNEFVNPATSATFALGATSGTLTGSNEILQNPTNPNLGFLSVAQTSSANAVVGETDPSFSAYDLTSAFPLTTGGPSIGPTPAIFTISIGGQSGTLEFDDSASPNMTFQAITGAAPEPSAWALMLAGVFGIGAALRTRRAPRPAGA